MTEGDWLTCTDPVSMLDLLVSSGRASRRKLRLFAVACSRRVWDFLDDLGRGAVEMAELYADGLTGAEELRAARLACKSGDGRAVWYAAASDPLIAARNAALSTQSGVESERITQAGILRDVAGNPFRPIILVRGWLTPVVLDLASCIYEGRAFERMPELADALNQAGCGNADVLGHCRNPGPHTRGCWLLDLLLGKG